MRGTPRLPLAGLLEKVTWKGNVVMMFLCVDLFTSMWFLAVNNTADSWIGIANYVAVTNALNDIRFHWLLTLPPVVV